MKIGMIISRIGGEDGVALESEKWVEVLQRMGHRVFIAAGSFEGDVSVKKEYRNKIKSLSFGNGVNEKQRKKIFSSSKINPHEIIKDIEKQKEEILKDLYKWTKEKNIERLILENTNALPVHLPLAKAIKELIEKTKIKTIAHNHDFYWERNGKYKSPHKEINDLIKSLFPLRLPQVKQVVINSFSKEKLKNNFGLESFYIPNVMDFEKSFGNRTGKSKKLMKKIGLKKEDISLFQITRIIKRKNIETAIKLIKEIDDERVKLVITGSSSDDPKKEYYNQLKKMVKNLKLEKRVLFKGNIFFKRGFFIKTPYFNLLRKRETYNSFDAYSCADACTYFSEYEGFGNAFVEALVAKKPIFVNNYKPVFWPDIGSKGFKIVMLKNNKLTKKAVKEIEKTIYNKDLLRKIGEYNFRLGKKHFSYDVLEKKLKKII